VRASVIAKKKECRRKKKIRPPPTRGVTGGRARQLWKQQAGERAAILEENIKKLDWLIQVAENDLKVLRQERQLNIEGLAHCQRRIEGYHDYAAAGNF
jgi:hypothetical protein